MTDLKLIALDEEDLGILSAQVQDALVRVEDIGFIESDQRFALVMNRFDWTTDFKKGSGQRRRTGLHFDRVTDVKTDGIDMNAREGVLELLSISYRSSCGPEGEVDLIFAGGGTIRLTVECIEARLRDLGAVWAAKAWPKHALEEDGS